ncbi:hypothetical protein MNEG_10682 [Monoraphidium neglectum]|uniref:Uncharacterized protein n=1 Tax=Monoraphidium neglectum TaxID=145388 RepID=A0A0D2MRT9_9CHLO|nr:hypothetical protein MNEG_10682 [Monoraphidium neglectum]KIY97280.1 hypothetical protein MNEG_10682 [Monoraphidium neglectum]|eukprot:XP_013896300.1 hypothetical protein MNEG_10682 [Monoraphidium neglectum]
MFSKPGSSAASDPHTLKSGRAQCYAARDAFYQCVRECGQLYTIGSDVPSKCTKLRAAYEGTCLPSWVKHFDEQQTQEARAAKRLHTAIQHKASTAAGNLSGAAQR